jgi:hypothetical protein
MYGVMDLAPFSCIRRRKGNKMQGPVSSKQRCSPSIRINLISHLVSNLGRDGHEIEVEAAMGGKEGHPGLSCQHANEDLGSCPASNFIPNQFGVKVMLLY